MFIFAKIRQYLLLLGDIAVLFSSLYITLYIRYSQTYISSNWQGHFYPFALIYFLWIIIFYSQNLYNLTVTKNNLYFFRTLFESFAINILIASFIFYFTPFFGIAPKTNLFLNAAIALALLIMWRGLYNLFLAKYIFRNKIAFLGYSKEVEELITTFKNDPQLGYECACVVTDEKNPDIKETQFSITEFIENFKKIRPNTIAVHHQKNLDRENTNKLYQLIFTNVHFTNLLRLYEEATGKLPLETLSQGWFLDNLHESDKKIYNRIKLSIDYILAAILGVCFVALFIPVSALILITSGRPVFYTQERIGKGGKNFKIHKFRTMVKNAETGQAQFAQDNDPRVTSFGKFLRQTRIDELPQVINILKGEMSFIGPRPERPEFVRELTEKASFYPLRHLIKPGLTGWAQIRYSYAGSIDENIKKLQYDIYYVKNRSLFLDITIALKTINIILRFRGR